MKTTTPPKPSTSAEPMFTQSFDSLEGPSDMPAWVVVIVLGLLVLTWGAVTLSLDSRLTRTVPAARDVPRSTEIS